MEQITLENISFDEEDAKLLTLDTDLMLKAKGIQYSILPKLEVILEEAISSIRKIYGIEIFNTDSIITKSPNFRVKRKYNLKVNYNYAIIGIAGKIKNIWNGLYRNDKKPVKILPYRLCIQFDRKGFVVFFSTSRKMINNFTIESRNKYNTFIKNNIQYIQTLLYFGNFIPHSFYKHEENEQVIIKFNDFIEKMFNTQNQSIYFYRRIGFPINIYELKSVVNTFVLLYPIYDSILRIAKNEKDIFKTLIGKLKYNNVNLSNIKIENDSLVDEEEAIKILSNNIDEKNIVRAGIRWQVFERDDFKCISCGRSAKDGAILHVDHIIPRSKGGKDIMDNYQTLCHICNIGKSNKSTKDLRIKK
jgi:hypothetical protein